MGLKRNGEQCEVWAVNGTLQASEATLHLQSWTLDGQPVEESNQHIRLAANTASELAACPFRLAPDTVLSAQLIQHGQIVARASAWHEPFKYLTLPHPGVTITPSGEDSVVVRTERPAKGVFLSTDAPLLWSDNMLDVFPGDPQRLSASGLGSMPVRVTWLHEKIV